VPTPAPPNGHDAPPAVGLPRLPYAAPRGLDPRALLVVAFAAGGASVASLDLMRGAPWWVVLFGAVVSTLFGGALLYVPRGPRLAGALGANVALTTLGVVMIAYAEYPSGSKLYDAVVTGPIVALPVLIAVLPPSLYAVRAAKQPAHDALDRVAVVASLWTALVPGGLGLMGVGFYWLTGESFGRGGLTWVLHALALAIGAVLAGVALVRDRGRARFLRAVHGGGAAGWEIAPRAATPPGSGALLPYLAGGGDEAALVAHVDEGAAPFRRGRVARAAAWISPDAAVTVPRRRLVGAMALVLAQVAAAAAFARDWLAHRTPLTAVEVAAGYYHTCARRDDGKVLCWGTNLQGRIDRGDRESRFHPVEVAGLDDATNLAAGAFFTCALRPSGEVVCLGSFLEGPSALRRIEGLPPARKIVAGFDLACALTRDGEVYCWELGPVNGGRFVQKETRARRVLKKADGVTDLGISHGWGCALGGFDLVCFEAARLDAGFRSEEVAPAQPSHAPGGVGYEPGSLAVGGPHGACAVTVDGLVHCWDRSPRDGTIRRPDWDRGAVVPGPRGARKVVLRDEDLCVLDRAGAVRCWKKDGAGGEPLLDRVVELVGSHDTACAVRDDRTLWCWGDRNDGGTLGDGTRHGHATPVLVRR
jgi:hypothetical protein